MDLFTETDFSLPFPAAAVEKPYGVYPGPASFCNDYDDRDYREWVEQSNGDPVPAPLAVYVQDDSLGGLLPVGVERVPASLLLDAIELELKLQGTLFDSDRPVQQFICSGSIATEWSDEQLHRLVSVVQESLLVNKNGLARWCACMRVVPSEDRVRLLQTLGFSNLRFAYVDQGHEESTLDTLKPALMLARQLGIKKIVLELVDQSTGTDIGNPGIEAFLAETGPDRVRLVSGNENQYQSYSRILSALGYHNIGLDWFLRPDDLWMKAKNDGRLHWSLLGFTDLPSPDVVGIGPGALSSVGEFYGVNESRWEPYQALLKQGRLPVVRGLELEADDVLRREIMAMILVGSTIRVSVIEEKWGIQFDRFFATETDHLLRFEQRGWIDRKGDEILIRSKGYRELTEICKVFDHRSRLQLSRSGPSGA